jgi:hypothetical protein
MSFSSTMQFLRTGTSSGCGPTSQAVAGARSPERARPPARSLVRTLRSVWEPTLLECPAEGQVCTPWGCFKCMPVGYAGDIDSGPHHRYLPGRARVPWMDTYGGGGMKSCAPAPGCSQRTPMAGLSRLDEIKHGAIRIRRGTVARIGMLRGVRVGSIPQTRGG